jgi:Fe-S-cluster containining protein
LSRAIARRDELPKPKLRALPVRQDAEHERICPLLHANQRCSVYADRPLGCRTFFCDRASRGAGPEPDELLALVGRVQALAARHALGGELARPLLRVLEG